MGPRSCKWCRINLGPGRIEPCYRCGASTGHAHVTVVNRHGQPVAQVAVCGDHTPEGGTLPAGRQRPAQATEGVAVKPRKLAYDRARRAAIRDVLDAHPEAYRQALDRRTREVGDG